MYRSIGAVKFVKGTNTYVRRSIRRTEAQVKSKGVYKVEHCIFEMPPLKLIGNDRVKKYLRLLYVTEGFEEPSRDKSRA